MAQTRALKLDSLRDCRWHRLLGSSLAPGRPPDHPSDRPTTGPDRTTSSRDRSTDRPTHIVRPSTFQPTDRPFGRPPGLSTNRRTCCWHGSLGPLRRGGLFDRPTPATGGGQHGGRIRWQHRGGFSDDTHQRILRCRRIEVPSSSGSVTSCSPGPAGMVCRVQRWHLWRWVALRMSARQHRHWLGRATVPPVCNSRDGLSVSVSVSGVRSGARVGPLMAVTGSARGYDAEGLLALSAGKRWKGGGGESDRNIARRSAQYRYRCLMRCRATPSSFANPVEPTPLLRRLAPPSCVEPVRRHPLRRISLGRPSLAHPLRRPPTPSRGVE